MLRLSLGRAPSVVARATQQTRLAWAADASAPGAARQHTLSSSSVAAAGTTNPTRRRTMASAAAGDAATPPPPPPPFHALTYAYVPDILERRGPYRAAHIDAAKAAVAAGKMVMAGATGDPVSGALFVWAAGVPRADIEAFAAGDPYVQAGLVTGWSVEPYMVVAQK